MDLQIFILHFYFCFVLFSGWTDFECIFSPHNCSTDFSPVCLSVCFQILPCIWPVILICFLLYTIMLNTGTKTGCDCNARPGIIHIFLFCFLFQIMSNATGVLLVLTLSIFKNSLMVACHALYQLETHTKKSNIKTTRIWPRLTHYLHSVTWTSIVQILQSEQKLFFFRFGVDGEVLFFIFSLLVIGVLSYLLWKQWWLVYGDFFVVVFLCSIFWMGECAALSI